MTKRYKELYILFQLLHVLANIAPICVYVILSLLSANLVHEKVALSMTVFVVLIMTIVSLINKAAMKSRLWIILIGVYICLESILTQLVVIGVCQILDELLIAPAANFYRWKARINKELDVRMGNG